MGAKTENYKKSYTKKRQTRLTALFASGGCVYFKIWAEFLTEVLIELEEAGLVKMVDKKDNEKKDFSLIHDLKKDIKRCLTNERRVGFLHKTRKYCSTYQVPFIRLSGKWLARFGFDVGQKFLIYPKENQLILKKFGACSDGILW